MNLAVLFAAAFLVLLEGHEFDRAFLQGAYSGRIWLR
jgi:hypothetical protein